MNGEVITRSVSEEQGGERRQVADSKSVDVLERAISNLDFLESRTI